MSVKVEWWDKHVDLLGKVIYVKHSKEFSDVNDAILLVDLLSNYISRNNIAMYCDDNVRNNNEKC